MDRLINQQNIIYKKTVETIFRKKIPVVTNAKNLMYCVWLK